MTGRFIDQYLPDCIPGYPCTSSPVWNNAISRVASGAENARQIWAHPLHSYNLPVATRAHGVLEGLKNMWMVLGGNAKTFPFRDPLDFASIPLVNPNQAPAISDIDQVLGVGNGAQTTFQLQKKYSLDSGDSYTRIIQKPIVSSVVASVNGIGTGSFTVNRLTGEITFAVAPPNGHIVRAGFLFDVEVRFADNDTYAGVMRAYVVSGFETINLVEVRPC